MDCLQKKNKKNGRQPSQFTTTDCTLLLIITPLALEIPFVYCTQAYMYRMLSIFILLGVVVTVHTGSTKSTYSVIVSYGLKLIILSAKHEFQKFKTLKTVDFHYTPSPTMPYRFVKLHKFYSDIVFSINSTYLPHPEYSCFFF